MYYSVRRGLKHSNVTFLLSGLYQIYFVFEALEK
ncbi:MAG: hypothetical protein ACI8UG_001534 [Gammaproteobacteria bacterium]